MPSTDQLNPLTTDRDFEQFQRILHLCFGVSLDDAGSWLDSRRAITRLLRDERGDVAAGAMVIDMGQWFGGRSVRMLGVAGVGTAPEARGRGAATRLVRPCPRNASRGCALSCLYPATQPLYRRAGFEQAGASCIIRIPLRSIQIREKFRDTRPVADADMPRIREMYDRWAAVHDGAVAREDIMWKRVTHPRIGQAHAFVVEHSGVIEGAVHFVPQCAPGHEWRSDLHVTDLTALTPEAGRRLLELLGDFRSLGEDAILRGGIAHPALLHLPEQSYRIALKDHWMTRLLDVRGALEGRGYARHLSAELELDVTDDLIEGNNGRCTLRVRDGHGRVEPGGTGRMTIDVASLAAMYTGHLSAASLATAGRLRADADSIAAANALFAGHGPWMADHF